MNLTKNHRQFLLIIKIATITIFLGRAWQFLFWDAPYRTLLWDQPLMEPLVNFLFSMSWEEWASSSIVDANIQLSIRITGWFFVIAAFMVLFISKKKLWAQVPVWIGIVCLLFLFILQTKEKFYHFGQFFEHASQLGTPIILIAYIKEWFTEKRLIVFIKILIASTFFCHGLYAINYYPRPGVFVDLLVNTFGTSEPFAHQFIFVIGIIDLLIVPMLFIPKLVKIALWYTFIWGIATALSRITAGFYIDFPWQSLHQVTHTTVFRLCHGLLPLALMILLKYQFKFSFRKKEKYKLV